MLRTVSFFEFFAGTKKQYISLIWLYTILFDLGLIGRKFASGRTDTAN